MGNKRKIYKLKMKCPNCNQKLEKVEVKIEDAKSPAISYQCSGCDYYSFEPETTMKVINEIKAKESPLKMKQKIIKLSKDRLGMYFNQDIVNSLNLKSGEDIFISVPEKNKIVLEVE